MSHSDLIERLEKLTGPDRDIDLELAKISGKFPASARYVGPYGYACANGFGRLVPPYTGSLDATEILRQAALPGSRITVQQYRGEVHVTLWCMHENDRGWFDGSAIHDAEINARLIATLRALDAKGTTP